MKQTSVLGLPNSSGFSVNTSTMGNPVGGIEGEGRKLRWDPRLWRGRGTWRREEELGLWGRSLPRQEPDPDQSQTTPARHPNFLQHFRSGLRGHLTTGCLLIKNAGTF